MERHAPTRSSCGGSNARKREAVPKWLKQIRRKQEGPKQLEELTMNNESTMSRNLKALITAKISPSFLSQNLCLLHNLTRSDFHEILNKFERCSTCKTKISIGEVVKLNGEYRCKGWNGRCGVKYYYSFCTRMLTSEDLGFQKHCVHCQSCRDSRCQHCHDCGECYIPIEEGAACPCHGAPPLKTDPGCVTS